MSIRTVLKSESTVWLLGVFGVVGSSAIAYSKIGWFGIAIIGLIGLMISVNNSLFDDAPASGAHGSGDVEMISRQIEAQRSQMSPEQKMAAAAAKAKRSRKEYAVKLFFLSMTLSGFWLFSQYQI